MKKRFIVLILVLAVFSLSGGIVLWNRCKKESPIVVPTKECPVSSKEMTVRGSSMYPFIKPDETVQALFGYYNCYDVSRNDVVLYSYSGNKNLLIKSVKGIPGDQWNLREENGTYEIVVNGVSLLNSEGKPYEIPRSSAKILQLYTKDYPVIPADTYLLLGDETGGSVDSTRFGLISKSDIMAKVEIVK